MQAKENTLRWEAAPAMQRSVISDSLLSPWTVAHQAPLSMGFSRQEYWGGLPFPTPGDIPDPGIESWSLLSSALAGGFFTTGPPGKYPLSQQLLLISVKFPVNLSGQTHAHMCMYMHTHTPHLHYGFWLMVHAIQISEVAVISPVVLVAFMIVMVNFMCQADWTMRCSDV